jgi:hypothetical protein
MNRVLVASAAAVLVAACGPTMKIIKQAPADQLAGKTSIALVAVDFTNVQVNGKPEADFLAKKDAEGKRQWEDAKKGIEEEFSNYFTNNAKGLTVTPQASAHGAALVVKPVAEYIDPGYYAVFSQNQSILRVTVQVLNAEGAVLDEISLQHRTPGDLHWATDERRLREDGQVLGKEVAKYLLLRTGLAK